MNLNKTNKGFTLLELLIVIFIIAVLTIPLTLWTDSNLDFWISYYKGVEVNVPYWISFILTFVLNGFNILLNIIASLARYCI